MTVLDGRGRLPPTMRQEPAENHSPEQPRCPVGRTARRVGVVVFLFFLVKGLAWLSLPALAYFFW